VSCPESPRWLPRQASEKHRRLYLNFRNMDKKDFEKILKALVEAFRWGLYSYYKARGYRLTREFSENPGEFGPNPGVLWVNVVGQREVEAVVCDSSMPYSSDRLSATFTSRFEEILKSRGYMVKCLKLLNLSPSVTSSLLEADLSRCIYVSTAIPAPEEPKT